PPASTSAPAAAGTAPAGATTAAGGTAAPAARAAPHTNVKGSLVVYSALNESPNNAFIDGFRNAYPGVAGADVRPLPAAGELQTRILSEKNSPKADIFIGGSSEFHDPLGTQGLLEHYKSPNGAQVDPKFKDPDGSWTGWYIGTFG